MFRKESRLKTKLNMTKKTLEEDKERLIELKKDKENLEIERDKEIAEYKNKIMDFNKKISIEKGRGLKIKKGSSNNFMDYDISRLYFDKFQCLVMQQEAKSFYNG